jgi:probable F420-dependent oxidoreductase
MRIGAVFPQTEIGNDTAAIRAYTHAVEALGFHHIQIYDHVIGANTASRPNWRGPYTIDTAFHEVFVLYGFIAAITQRIELGMSVVILPQRQTVLVAKQAAELDLLSGGRLRLGVGVGWNEVEYEALGENFHNRGARCDEQIELMRQLWCNRAVTFHGRWHTVTDAGIKPRPIQQPIPIWIGGSSQAALRRVGRLGDGWFPQRPADEEAQAMVATIHQHAIEAGRSPKEIGIEPILNTQRLPQHEWRAFAQQWEQLGATHLSINTMGSNLSISEHITLLQRVAHVFGIN